MRNYPDGKLDPTDEGEVNMAITLKKGRVMIYFNAQLKWIGLLPTQARQLARALNHYADKAETPPPLN